MTSITCSKAELYPTIIKPELLYFKQASANVLVNAATARTTVWTSYQGQLLSLLLYGSPAPEFPELEKADI